MPLFSNQYICLINPVRESAIRCSQFMAEPPNSRHLDQAPKYMQGSYRSRLSHEPLIWLAGQIIRNQKPDSNSHCVNFFIEASASVTTGCTWRVLATTVCSGASLPSQDTVEGTLKEHHALTSSRCWEVASLLGEEVDPWIQ